MTDTETVELARITITKYLREDSDGYTFRYETSDGLSLVDTLGMLAFTEHAVVADQMHGQDEDGDQ